MPSVTRRNQVLKELDRCQLEFQIMSLPPPPPVTVVPDDVHKMLVKHNLPWNVYREIDQHFTNVPEQKNAQPKPTFVLQMNQLRDMATLAQEEQHIKYIFEQVALIRAELVAWQSSAV